MPFGLILGCQGPPRTVIPRSGLQDGSGELVKGFAGDLVAEGLGYIRDPALSRLAHYRWEGKQRVRETLVYLTHYPDRGERYPRIYPAAEEESGMLGYALETVKLGDYPSARRLGDMLWHRSVRGILLAPILSGRAIPGLGWDRFSVIAFEEGHAEIKVKGCE